MRLETVGARIPAAFAFVRGGLEHLLDLIEAGLDALEEGLNRAKVRHRKPPKIGVRYSVVDRGANDKAGQDEAKP